MKNITFEQFNNAVFTLYENNPIIKNPFLSGVIADPSVLTPDETHDGRWHLFCHTFYGVYHYSSDNGVDFHAEGKVVSRAMRPDINRINGRYYLFYERIRPAILAAASMIGVKWYSEIYCTESDDLKSWSRPVPALKRSRPFEVDKHGQAISNPFLISTDSGYRLYYSCGQTFVPDCGFCEPTHITFAESRRIANGYLSRSEPIISPDKNVSYLNLGCGCIKVYKLKDCYIGLQNGIYQENGKSHSAIMLLRSDDGIKFDFVKPFLVPQLQGNSNWMAQFVYACSLTYYKGKLRLYFNARNVANNVQGRERIGIYEAEL